MNNLSCDISVFWVFSINAISKQLWHMRLHRMRKNGTETVWKVTILLVGSTWWNLVFQLIIGMTDNISNTASIHLVQVHQSILWHLPIFGLAKPLLTH
jgi:hypothetical protein